MGDTLQFEYKFWTPKTLIKHAADFSFFLSLENGQKIKMSWALF